MIAVQQSGKLLLQEEVAHILVVDDEASNRMLLQRVLMASHKVTPAETGEEALYLLSQETFDLVLLDIMMPGTTGLEVLERIRQTPEIAELPVILVSALSDTENMVKGLQLGANDYIAKPIDIDAVTARVDTQLQMKHMMDVYRQSIAELETAQRMKDRLFRIASHDLKSPLSTVVMAEALMRQMFGGDPTADDILDTLKTTVRNMNGVIEEFLSMAACQSGGIEVHLELIPVQSVVAEVVAEYTMVAQEKNIKLNVDDVPGDVLADKTRLKQILTNLLSNAIKYSPQHTTTTLWSEDFGDQVRIYVADQGPGIPEDEQERLFMEFSKLSTRPTGDESSTGLGLWIVKHIAALQNGTVGVECPPEGGSNFWVELPAS